MNMLSTWAQKITCRRFDWMLHSSSGRKITFSSYMRKQLKSHWKFPSLVRTASSKMSGGGMKGRLHLGFPSLVHTRSSKLLDGEHVCVVFHLLIEFFSSAHAAIFSGGRGRSSKPWMISTEQQSSHVSNIHITHALGHSPQGSRHVCYMCTTK